MTAKLFRWATPAVGDLLGLLVCTVSMWLWLVAITKRPCLAALGVILLVNLTYAMAGSGITRFLSLDPEFSRDFATRFLFGYVLVNGSLFALCLPPLSFLGLTITGNFALTFMLVAAVWAIGQRRSIRTSQDDGHSAVSPLLVCLAVSLVGSTLWTQDSFTPIAFHGDSATIKPWQDSFIHSMVVRMFSEHQGGASLQHFFMTGTSAPIYHYAAYMSPALVAANSGISPFDVFNGFAVPSGLAMTGMAAYVLGRRCWGEWPGVAGVVALMLLPNASVHAISIPWFSYHWLVIISPTLSYGIVVIAVAWYLMFEAIRCRRWSLVAASYGIAVLGAVFKAQIFVAAAPLIFVYPFLFWRNFSPRVRSLASLSAIIACFLVIEVSHKFTSIPFIRLDFSSAQQYATLVMAQVETLGLDSFLSSLIESHGRLLVPVGWTVIFWGTFGFFGVAYLTLFVIRRRDLDGPILWFPLLTMLLYLLMSLGLAYDRNLIGTPEELLHRPFVWAYFVVCCSSAMGIYWSVFGDNLPSGPVRQSLFAAGLTALFVIPYFSGQQVHQGPRWGKRYSQIEVPSALVEAAFYIRTHTVKGDVVQDSENDPKCLVSALSARQAYFIDYEVQRLFKRPTAVQERSAEVESFKSLTLEKDVLAWAADRRIAMYLLHPNDQVQWPRCLAERLVFEAAGFRVYRFH